MFHTGLLLETQVKVSSSYFKCTCLLVYVTMMYHSQNLFRTEEVWQGVYESGTDHDFPKLLAKSKGRGGHETVAIQFIHLTRQLCKFEIKINKVMEQKRKKI